MARPTLLTHRKFRRLVARLNGDTATAMGSLELLWLAAYESGDDIVGDATDVEAAACWRGATGDLAAALADAGFLDRDGDRFVIHDLDDHAPDYVQKRRARELERRQRGVSLREIRAAAGAAGGKQTASKRQANGGHLPANGKQTASTWPANGVTPAPAPAPSDNNHAQPAAERVLVSVLASPRFDLDALYAAYPRKQGKAKGLARLKSIVKTDADYRAHVAAIANLNAHVARDLPVDYVPHFSTWANGKWEDYRDGIPVPPRATAAKATAPEPQHRPDTYRRLSDVTP